MRNKLKTKAPCPFEHYFNEVAKGRHLKSKIIIINHFMDTTQFPKRKTAVTK